MKKTKKGKKSGTEHFTFDDYEELQEKRRSGFDKAADKRKQSKRTEAVNAIRTLLAYIGEDPGREGLVETPDRMLRSYEELFSGYRFNTEKKIAQLFKVFEDGACDELVLVKNIDVMSFCEHHFLPVVGKAHVAYIPNGKIVGLSKLARIVEVFARRLQVQERLTTQITRAIDRHLKPLGSACVIEAKHGCMSCRGVRQQNSVMITSSLTGEFKDNQLTRQEFMSLIKG